MLSVGELNYGHAMYGSAPAISHLLDILGQGDGITVCAQWYARLRRTTGRPNVDIEMYPILVAASLVTPARNGHSGTTDAQQADLVAFVVERGMGYLERTDNKRRD